MKNKILALDIGSKNTGIAISDRTQSIAFSYTTVKTLELKNQLELIIEKEKIQKIVIGKNLYQSKNFQVEDYVIKYIPHNIEYTYYNEDFSTEKAKQIAKLKGLTDKEFKEKKDEIAATVILQEYIDEMVAREGIEPSTSGL
ncbi:pre-16S rRNA-processing nuclease YqgF [bacterium]|nr:pre-16S rRNA-processing nuclease YqgF [bacterium]MBT6293869.1 pre-16S rRNA-processing nuclease YqgF [bacterium]